MKKRMIVFALAIVVGAVAISAISSAYRSPSHWRPISTASVLSSLLHALTAASFRTNAHDGGMRTALPSYVLYRRGTSTAARR